MIISLEPIEALRVMAAFGNPEAVRLGNPILSNIILIGALARVRHLPRPTRSIAR